MFSITFINNFKKINFFVGRIPISHSRKKQKGKKVSIASEKKVIKITSCKKKVKFKKTFLKQGLIMILMF